MPAPVAAYVENTGGSQLDFLGRFLPPGKGFMLAREASGKHTAQIGDAPPAEVPPAELRKLVMWRNADHPMVRITGSVEGMKLLDRPITEKPVERAQNAASLSW